MTYYISLQDILIFFCTESKDGFSTIRQIAEAIKYASVEETRECVIDFLIQNEIVLGYHDESTGKFHVEKTNK